MERDDALGVFDALDKEYPEYDLELRAITPDEGDGRDYNVVMKVPAPATIPVISHIAKAEELVGHTGYLWGGPPAFEVTFA